MKNSKLVSEKNNVVVETDVVIFPMDEIFSDESKISINQKALENYVKVNDNKPIKSLKQNIQSK